VALALIVLILVLVMGLDFAVYIGFILTGLLMTIYVAYRFSFVRNSFDDNYELCAVIK